MLLKTNQEIVGFLHAVSEEDSCCKLQISCNHELELPTSAIPKKKLASLVGKRVGIFCYDGQFFLREI